MEGNMIICSEIDRVFWGKLWGFPYGNGRRVEWEQ